MKKLTIKGNGKTVFGKAEMEVVNKMISLSVEKGLGCPKISGLMVDMSK